MTFAAAVFIFIFLFKFLKPTSEIDNGDLQRKLGLASSIIYNFLFNNITLMLMLLAIKWPTYVWAPETSAEAAPEPVPVPLVPTVPLAENTAAVEEHRAVAEERAHEEQPEVVRTSV
ncbi:hypothetical protein SCHPADRAFT_901156 [Schizopora paradoxa]|uniref:Uncharacterized protein n=1 Tax=Schizopora paradoxa TaxID=27342 RepID=A0A0H2S577_9AGAM|nr:hypothetical protein SCHPADRAFT_901156 [Schizopora paradoxa]